MQKTEVQRIWDDLKRTELSQAALLRKFQAAARSEVKLACALYGFLQGENDDVYPRYLKTRIRPAAAELIQAEQVNGLMAFDRCFPFSEALTDEFLKTAITCGAQESIVYLLKLKAQRFGFRDRDFTL